jgi:hypothetical protein
LRPLEGKSRRFWERARLVACRSLWNWISAAIDRRRELETNSPTRTSTQLVSAVTVVLRSGIQDHDPVYEENRTPGDLGRKPVWPTAHRPELTVHSPSTAHHPTRSRFQILPQNVRRAAAFFPKRASARGRWPVIRPIGCWGWALNQ